MKQIKFPDTEIGELKNFYRIELDKATRRVEDIKGIIAKLKPAETKAITTGKAKRGRPRLDAASKPKVKKQTRKPRATGKSLGRSWVKFVPETLKRENKFLTINEVATLASKEFSIDAKDRDRLVKTLGVSVPRLAKQKILIAKSKAGSKAKFYGLPSWSEREKKVVAAPAAVEASKS